MHISTTTVVILNAFFFVSIFAETCPSPCWCVDNFSIVVCNQTDITEVPNGIPRTVQTLLMSSNRIAYIPKAAFEGLNQLQTLDLSSNKLKEDSFQIGALDLPNLRTLNLSSNMYTSIPQDLPPNLSLLQFYNNPISILKSNSFASATSLQYVILGYNQISTIEENAFDPLSNAIKIDLSGNNLEDGSFNPNVFAQNRKLTHLILNYNKLKSFPDTSQYPPSLRSLDILGNAYETIPSYALRTLTNIISLGVWGGKVTTLEPYAFSGLNNLTDLDLEQSHISTIKNMTFAGLESLEALYLFFNDITKIEVGGFYGLNKLQHISMTYNKLTTLESAVLDTIFIPKLSQVSIDGNPWTCDCHLRWLREKMDNATYTILNPSWIRCNEPPELKGKTWDVLKPTDFICK